MKNTVGEEETILKVNTSHKMSFADQLIERREGSTFNVKSRASLTPLSDRTYTRTAETMRKVNFIVALQAVRSNYEGRGVTIGPLKPTSDLSSATQVDRGAKPMKALNFKPRLSLPIMKTVGEEETNFFLNSMEEMSFADQSIERREESISNLNPTLWMTSLSDRTYTRTAEPRTTLNSKSLLSAVRSNHEGRGVTMIGVKPIVLLSSTTQRNRGAKLNFGMNSTAAVSLPLTGMVGEEPTGYVNPINVLYFVDQLIERREIHVYNGTHFLHDPSLRQDLYSDGGTHRAHELHRRLASRPKQSYGSRSDHYKGETHRITVLHDPAKPRGKAQGDDELHM